jgi:hypothetical protein
VWLAPVVDRIEPTVARYAEAWPAWGHRKGWALAQARQPVGESDYVWGAPEDRDPARANSIFRPNPDQLIGVEILAQDYEASFAGDFEFRRLTTPCYAPLSPHPGAVPSA